MIALAALALSFASEPSDQAVVYYNARMALREGSPLEAAKLWLLRNAIEDHTQTVSVHDDDFRSVTWTALGDLGVCQDGFPVDTKGAGLWPLAMHNWVVRNRSRRSANRRPNPFDAFEAGEQARLVNIGDVLSVEELTTVSLFRGGCVRPRILLILMGEKPTARLSDRGVSARLLRHLIRAAGDTLVDERVRGRPVLAARMFDIHLQLISIAEREARRRSRQRIRIGRQAGLSKAAVERVEETALEEAFAPGSEPARILEESVEWTNEDWLRLSPQRQMFLFDQARAWTEESEAFDRIALGILDHLIASDQGEAVNDWIARISTPERVWSGERGERLLAMDVESGFRERGPIALHRGVDHLSHGDLPEALRSFAYALDAAPESGASEALSQLSFRWLSYVAGQFEITDELLITLQALVPRRPYATLLEDLMWGAALRADQQSFDRGLLRQPSRSALSRRTAMLTPLARGEVGAFLGRVRTGLNTSPSETIRFLDQLIQRLEREDATVRTAHIPTLRAMREELVPIAAAEGRIGRTATELLARSQAITEGLVGLEADASSADKARALAPGGEVFAGAVRLAPADPLPWPFRPTSSSAPPIWERIVLTPIEWRDESGNLVFGWSLSG